MLLEGLITNSPGIKMGQKNGQKVLKNAKKSQNTFHLISTVSKLLSEVEPWTVKRWCGQKMLPDLAKSCQKVIPDLAKIHQKVLPDWCKKCQNRTGGPIKKCYCKDLSQIVQG